MHDEDARPQMPRRRFVAGLAGALGGGALSGVAQADAAAHWQGPMQRGSGWLEWHLPALPQQALAGAPGNPFDPAQFDLWVHFRGPRGRRLRATVFWSRDTGAAQGFWAVRLLPPVAGRWRALPGGQIAGSAAAPGAAFEFKVAQVPPQQRIVVDPLATTHFAFDDGTPFVPVGLNICWAASDQVLDDYRRWFTRLAAQGGNFARLWMASWSFAIEWKDTGLGDYSARLDRAALLDAVFELAESLGIRLMLCLVNHGAFTEKNDAEWADNPYNRARGGPLARPEDFVTDETAQQLFERRMRYIAARWAHSPALHSWEWWNEVTWTPIANAALRPWHRRMGRVLDRHDPYRRLRSTSWADRGDAVSWRSPALDYAQQHDYTTRDPLLHYAEAARSWRADGITDKPLLAGELGLLTTHDAKQPRPFNWDGVHLHNGLWAPLFHGFAGTALYWWWDHMVDPLDVWPAYRGVARWLQAVQAAGLRLGRHRPQAAEYTGGPARALALVGPGGLLLWVRADLHDAGALQRAWRAETGGQDPARPWAPTYPLLAGGRVHVSDVSAVSAVPGLAAPTPDEGTVQVQWIDTISGDTVAQTRAALRAGTLDLACPPFQRGLAAIVRPVRKDPVG